MVYLPLRYFTLLSKVSLFKVNESFSCELGFVSDTYCDAWNIYSWTRGIVWEKVSFLWEISVTAVAYKWCRCGTEYANTEILYLILTSIQTSCNRLFQVREALAVYNKNFKGVVVGAVYFDLFELNTYKYLPRDVV